MLVILDTTETYDSLMLDTPDFKLLHSFLSTKPATLIVPRVVVQETVNHYRERLAATVTSVSDKLRSLHHLTPSRPEVALPEIDLEATTREYEDNLKKRLKALSAEIPDYEEIEVASLVERALQRRKPFDPKGRVGFRDAVLWESVLHLLRNKPDKAVIITNNTNDFGLHGSLAPHLCEDLKTIGLSEDSLSICAGLGRFLDEFVKPHLEKLKQIQQRIEEDGYKSFKPEAFFKERFSDIQWELKRYVKRYNLDRIARKYSGEFREPSLVQLFDDIHWSRADDVWNVNDEEIAVGISFYVGGEIECVHETSEAPYGMRPEESFVGSVMFTLYMTIILKRESGEFVTWELNDADIEPDAWRCDDRDRYE
jgi:PIN domain